MIDGEDGKSVRSASKVELFFASAAAGLALVIAAFKFDRLNWIVDVPGHFVSHFISVDFHEGDGAAGLLLALLLSWFCTSAAVYVAGSLVLKGVQFAVQHKSLRRERRKSSAAIKLN
jgi:hypothetical protein